MMCIEILAPKRKEFAKNKMLLGEWAPNGRTEFFITTAKQIIDNVLFSFLNSESNQTNSMEWF